MNNSLIDLWPFQPHQKHLKSQLVEIQRKGHFITALHIGTIIFYIDSRYPKAFLRKIERKVMFKIFQARLKQYVNHEIPDVQAGFSKDRRPRDQIANICWIIVKAREFPKNTYFCFIDYAKAFDCVDHNKLEKSSRDGNTTLPYLPPEKCVFKSRSNS